MTVSFADVQNAIRDGVASLAVVPTSAVAWSDEQRPGGKVLLILDNVYSLPMQDRETYTEDEEVPGTFVWELSTLFYIRVQVRAEAIYNAPGSDAMVALEAVRAGLRRPTMTWDAGVIYQPDDLTYIHHVPSIHDNRKISGYALEMGFRAVVDYPLDGPGESLPNMQTVEVLESTIDTGEEDPVDYEATVERP